MTTVLAIGVEDRVHGGEYALGGERNYSKYEKDSYKQSGRMRNHTRVMVGIKVRGVIKRHMQRKESVSPIELCAMHLKCITKSMWHHKWCKV